MVAPLHTLVLLVLLAGLPATAQPPLSDKIEGLLVGSVIGDALGGPDEFQPPRRSFWTEADVVLSPAGRADLAARVALGPYTRRPLPEPYGQWTADAPAGTVTDDTRFKILFLQSLAESGAPDGEAFARAVVAWHADTSGVYGTLPREWLDEFAFGARWVLGDRDLTRARPPERMWGGIPTVAGQMPFLPVAALAPGDPDTAYQLTWGANWMDNGAGRDVTAALVAGLAAALAPNATWDDALAAMRTTDPFGFADVPWVERRVARWLTRAHDIAERSEGRPARLYALLEAEAGAETWWEAHVPLVVAVACAEVAEHDPMATLQLILEFGHDTDSSLTVAGALFGALHGADIFPAAMRTTVDDRLAADYGVRIADWQRVLAD